MDVITLYMSLHIKTYIASTSFDLFCFYPWPYILNVKNCINQIADVFSISIWGRILNFLKSFGFTWNAIAYMLLVSRWTLVERRRVLEYGIIDLVVFSKISSENLDNLIWSYRIIHDLGYGHSMLLGHLHSIGLNVQQKSVKESLVRGNLNGCPCSGWKLLGGKRKL